MPDPSVAEAEALAQLYLEDLMVEVLLASDSPVRPGAIAKALEGRGISLPANPIRGVLRASPRFVFDGRNWDLAIRRDAADMPLDGAIRTILRRRSLPMPLAELSRQVALAKQQGPKETAQLVQRMVQSRKVYFTAPNGCIGLTEWLLDTSGEGEEDVLFDNFFDDPAEAERVRELWPRIAGEDDVAVARSTLKALGQPLSLKTLQFACWRRQPEALQSAQNFLALTQSPELVVFSDHRVIEAEKLADIHKAITSLARRLEAVAIEGDEVVAVEELEVSDEDIQQAVALARRREAPLSLASLAEEALEILPDDPGYPFALAKLESALRSSGELCECGFGRWVAPQAIPAHVRTIPQPLLVRSVSQFTLQGEPVDAELDDEGLDADLAQQVRSPDREDVGEEEEVIEDPTWPALPEEVIYVLPYHHYQCGTWKIRKRDGQFFGSRPTAGEPADGAGPSRVVCAHFRYEQGGEFEVWANLELGLLFGLQDFYHRYCNPSGAVLRLRRTEVPGEFLFLYDGESDRETYLSEDRIQGLERLAEEAEARQLTVFDILAALMDVHREGATFNRISAEVNVVRRTRRRLVASTLSSYPCLYQRQRFSRLWHFDERKVDQGRSKNKKKYVRK